MNDIREKIMALEDVAYPPDKFCIDSEVAGYCAGLSAAADIAEAEVARLEKDYSTLAAAAKRLVDAVRQYEHHYHGKTYAALAKVEALLKEGA